MNICKNDISVVIPVYNGEDTIVKVLDSICNQTKVEYIKEIIVVNDGSTDRTKEIVENYIKNSLAKIVLINVENGGVSKARNIGMQRVSGGWIALCDSDDIWFANKIEIQTELINNNSKIDFLGGNHIRETQYFLWWPINDLKHLSVRELCIKMLPQTSTAIFKKEIFLVLGGYDEQQTHAEDANFFMRIAANYGYYYSPEQVVFYGDGKRGFGESGLSANVGKMHEGIIKNLKEMYDKQYFGFLYCLLMVAFENIKYFRRKMILRNEKKKNMCVYK